VPGLVDNVRSVLLRAADENLQPERGIDGEN
jgi:hypothetical protein